MQSIFPLLQCQRNIILLFSQHKTFCKTQKSTCEFHLYCWDRVCKVMDSVKLTVSIANLKFLLKHQLLHREVRKVFCMGQAFNGPLNHFFRNPKYLL